MGRLYEGKWVPDSFTAVIEDGKFVRPATVFRNRLTRDGSSGYPAESGRYHLYISLACPWAHRTLIVVSLKNLWDSISISIVDPLVTDDNGWVFSDYPGSIPDTLFNSRHLYEIYQKSSQDVTSRVSVPVLFDKQTNTIVSNESSEIIVMLNECFDGPDYYPSDLRTSIDEINQYVYDKINNGVYKTGIAMTQEAYEEALTDLFDALEKLEAILDKHRFLVGDRFTLADVRLFVTLVRFDPVYYGLFKCNLKMIQDFPNIWNYVRDIYQMEHIKKTVNFKHIKEHYYRSLTFINGTGIVPTGPEIDFDKPHDRANRLYEDNTRLDL